MATIIKNLLTKINESRRLQLALKNKLAFTKENMLNAPAADRNKQYIFDVLKGYLPSEGSAHVLEISSGTGQHVAHFAPKLPHVTFQPSDIDKQHLLSIAAHTADAGASNIKPPAYVDIIQPTNTPDNGNIADQSCDIVLNSNLVHISPWDTAVGLFSTAGRVLKPSGVLFMYGPYKIDGVLTPESNIRFDQSLRERDPQWGIRDIADLRKLAKTNGLAYEKMHDMPANNKCIIFRKTV